MDEEQVVKTKGEVLKDFLLDHYNRGVDFWQPYQDDWAAIRQQYTGIYLEEGALAE